jgi:excisionase family DNA binding protein
VASLVFRGKFWHVRFKDELGQKKQLPTKFEKHEKKAAKAHAHELEIQADRRAQGLEVAPARNLEKTLWSLCDWWLNKKCTAASRDIARLQLEKHVERTHLGGLLLQRATGEKLDDYFDSLEEQGYAPGTINKLRALLHSVFEKARDSDPVQWSGRNPVTKTRYRHVPQVMHETLRAEEVRRFLAFAPAEWRPCFAAALYLALRKGEAFGMRKEHYNRADHEIAIAVSHSASTTKGKKLVVLPVPPSLRPFLDEALKTPGPFLFPDSNGKQRSPEADPQKIVRSTLVAAGYVTGHRHTCRRCKALWREASASRLTGHVGTAPAGVGLFVGQAGLFEVVLADAEIRRCPTCASRMWPAGIPRPMTFHELRHTTATLLLREEVPMPHVQKIMRHASIRTTVGMYGHLDLGDMREAMKSLPEIPQAAPLRAVGGGVHMEDTAPVVAAAPSETTGIPESSSVVGEWALLVSNQRPLPCQWTTDASQALPSVTNGAEGFGISPDDASRFSHPSHPNRSVRKEKSTPEVHGGLRALDPSADLLTVAEVAARLRISPATVYSLCAAGHLRHSRIRHSIRVHPTDLAAYLRGGG